MLSRVVRPVTYHLPKSVAHIPMLKHEGGITRMCMPAVISSRGAASLVQRDVPPPPPGVPFALPNGVEHSEFLSHTGDEHDVFAHVFSPRVRLLDTPDVPYIDVDITETEAEIIVSAHLPGVKKEDIKVTLSPNNVLVICAERKEKLEEGDKKRHYTDFLYGQMRRDVVLPKNVDPDNIRADYEDGELTIRVRKKEGEESQKAISVT